jgi:large subunit ribosomal protein L21
MYAVFKCGVTQHRASVGDLVKVQLMQGEVGARIEIAEVLLVKKDEGALIGTPLVEGAKVFAEIVANGRDKKIIVQKFKRRKKYRRKAGHRQPFTRLKITDVVVP